MPALEAELSEFMDLWNTHLIRHNRLADCPSGVPKEMYETPGLVGRFTSVHVLTSKLYNKLTGASDCLKPGTSDIWVRAYLNESSDTPPFFPTHFKIWADEVLETDFNITQNEILPNMCKYVYLHLISQDPPTEVFQ